MPAPFSPPSTTRRPVERKIERRIGAEILEHDAPHERAARRRRLAALAMGQSSAMPRGAPNVAVAPCAREGGIDEESETWRSSTF